MPEIDPILLIHGYSSESKTSPRSMDAAVKRIYGSLPDDLRALHGQDAVVELNLSRYISLDDGVSIDDISRALDYALREERPDLLDGRFNVMIHSTGALVIRNWIRRFSKKPSPIRNLIHLAGANFGSGWAHIGQGQLAKWGRAIFEGAERGTLVLNALELGSSWTLDLHRYFLQPGAEMQSDYKVFEYAIIGSQADASWFMFPIRYAKEDGSDGVVRVSSGNLNFHYVRFGPTQAALSLARQALKKEHAKQRKLFQAGGKEFYEIKEYSLPGENGRPIVPLAIPLECAHSGNKLGIVSGTDTRVELMPLIQRALQVKSVTQWRQCVKAFQEHTDKTYKTVFEEMNPGSPRRNLTGPRRFHGLIADRRKQYDPHAQIVFRLIDQDRRPVEHFDIYFEGVGDRSRIGDLFEDKHKNRESKNIISFYLRSATVGDSGWRSRIEPYDGCDVHIWGEEPDSPENILYAPFQYRLDKNQLAAWVCDHRTTVVDVELLRIPMEDVFRVARP